MATSLEILSNEIEIPDPENSTLEKKFSATLCISKDISVWTFVAAISMKGTL